MDIVKILFFLINYSLYKIFIILGNYWVFIYILVVRVLSIGRILRIVSRDLGKNNLWIMFVRLFMYDEVMKINIDWFWKEILLKELLNE